MSTPAKPRTTAFTDIQIELGFWLIVSRSCASHLQIEEEVSDESIAESLEGLVGKHGLTRQHVRFAIPRICAARQAAQARCLVSISAAKLDRTRALLLKEWNLVSSKGALIWPPASRTVAVRLGGGNWNDALINLGLQPARGRARGSGRFDEESIARTICEYVQNCEANGVSATLGGYSYWSREKKECGRSDIPSAATIRQRFGTWAKALECACLFSRDEQHRDLL